MKRVHTDRLQELLADEALGGLDATCRSELEPLLRELPDAERDALMRTAALTQLAFLRRDASALQPMPASLRARLLGTAVVQRSAIKPG
jgi:ABC-type nitrate/sulfonate/bicarbonate transport system ATPase subunit